jgi:hypothetical protein
LNISAILKIKIIKQVKVKQVKILLPKHVLFSKSIEKYKSSGPRAKIVVVGAILNYSAIL